MQLLPRKGIEHRQQQQGDAQRQQREKKLNSTDSSRNCRIRCPLVLPATLRIPTSLARFALRAVLRFIKLTQAMSRISIAIKEKMVT